MAENKQYITQVQENGTVVISEDVIATIISNTVNEVEGVASLSTKPGADIAELIGKKAWAKGMKITIGEQDELYVDCNIIIRYGQSVVAVASDAPKETEVYKSELQRAIIKGLREEAARLTSELISSSSAPLDVVQNEIIPALDTVGIGFEKKTVYLPSLLMSAEAAKSAFEVIKANMPSGERGNKAPVVIATVKGDIHDIGKNIVRLLLENYGFNVIDLGRDVAPSVIAAKVAELNASVVALSALMTTTVPAMEETIKLVRVSAPNAKIIVGGAVLTQEYADMIGADKYAKDAMGAVRYAESICL